jgi:hypothetical protein
MRWKIIVTGRERQRETIIVVTMIEGVKETTTGERGRIIVGMIGVVIMIVMAGGVTTRNAAESDLHGSLHGRIFTRVNEEWINIGRTETGVIVMTTTAVTVVVIATASTTVVARLRMIAGIDETIAIVPIAAVGITTEGEVAIEAEVAVGNAVNDTDAAETAVRLPLRKVTSS